MKSLLCLLAVIFSSSVLASNAAEKESQGANASNVSVAVASSQEDGTQGIFVSATQMNILWRGIKNTIEVFVPGVSPSDISVSCIGGAMTGSGTIREVIPDSANIVKICVFSNENGKTQSLGVKEFRVFDIPDPVVCFSTIKKGETKAARVDLFNGIVEARVDNFPLEVSFEIVSFDISTVRNGSLRRAFVQGGNGALNGEAKEIIKSVAKGNQLFIDAVKAKGPDGRVRSLNGLTLTVN